MSYVYAHKKCMLAECLANPGHFASSFAFPVLLLLLLLLTTNVSENVLGVADSYFPKIATVICLCGVGSGEFPFSGNLHGLQPTECGGSGGTCVTSEARS